MIRSTCVALVLVLVALAACSKKEPAPAPETRASADAVEGASAPPADAASAPSPDASTVTAPADVAAAEPLADGAAAEPPVDAAAAEPPADGALVPTTGCAPRATRLAPILDAGATADGVYLCLVGADKCWRWDEASRTVAEVERPEAPAAEPSPFAYRDGAYVWADDGKPIDGLEAGSHLSSWTRLVSPPRIVVVSSRYDGHAHQPTTALLDATTRKQLARLPPCSTVEVIGEAPFLYTSDCQDGHHAVAPFDAETGRAAPRSIGAGLAGYAAPLQGVALPEGRFAWRARHGAEVLVTDRQGAELARIPLADTLGGPVPDADAFDDGRMFLRPDGDLGLVHGGAASGTFVRVDVGAKKVVSVARTACAPTAPSTPDAAGGLDFATLVATARGRAALLDALDRGPAPAPPGEPRADGWEGWSEEGGPAWGAGISADGTRFVEGAIGCDHVSCDAITLESRPVGATGPRKALDVAQATRLAPPLAPLPAVEWKGEGDHLAYTRQGGVSFLASAVCIGSEDTSGEGADLTCTWRVEARVPGYAAVELAREREDGVRREQSTRLYARAGAPALAAVQHICMAMDGCPPRASGAFALPRDVVRAYNALGLARLEGGELLEAQRAFEGALALDGAAELPRYNLACAHARQGHAADAAKALEPLVTGGAAAASRKKWLAKVKADPDFAGLLALPELQALLGTK